MSAQPRTFQAPVFSLQQIIPVQPTAEARTEAFAPFERTSASRSASTSTFIQAELPISGQGIVIYGLRSGIEAPLWMKTVINSLLERWGYTDGWDSYDAKATNPRLVAILMNELATALRHDSPAPVMVPLADGGMQAEWHRNRQDLELVVSADEPPRYYYFNEVTQEEEEGLIKGNGQRLRTLLARL